MPMPYNGNFGMMPNTGQTQTPDSYQSMPSQQFVSGWNSQPHQMQQSRQPFPSFVGRYISDLKEVTPNEVPTDGSIALFPTRDLTEIYLKTWGADGLIRTFRYELDTSADLTAPVAAPQQPDYQDLANRIAELEEKVKTSSRGKNTKGEEATK